MSPLAKFAADATGPVLVLHDRASADLAVSLGEQGHRVHELGGTLPGPEEWGGVALVVADRLGLRIAAPTLPHIGRAPAIACLLTQQEQPVHLVSRPEWPRVVSVHARRLSSGGALTVMHLHSPVEANVVLRELARLASPARPGPDRIAILGAGGSPVTSTRQPEVVVVPDRSMGDAALHQMAREAPVVVDPHLARGPLDEGVLNPIAFQSDPSHGMATLRADGPTGLRLHGVAGVDVMDLSRGVSDPVVTALRRHEGVRVAWDATSPDLERAVAGLAMAGVPLVGDRPPPARAAWLGDGLRETFVPGVDITDPLRREEHSVRQRRAALLTHSGPAWRERVARAAGHPTRRFPTCSVVLATRRPHQLDFAIRQVARQRSVDVELVVVAHGFEPDRGRFREQLDGLPAQVLSMPEDALFGEVLNAGVRATSGDVVVKMDDDDWYGREFLLDLLLAREYSGADVVGTTAEFIYLHQLDRTVRGRASAPGHSSEKFTRFVAGGTLSLRRDLLNTLGGFRPVRRFVDRQLLHAAWAVGATVYRAHGLGYLLRRTASGHTWDPGGVEYFVDSDRVSQQWDGFVPSRLLQVDPADLPTDDHDGAW